MVMYHCMSHLTLSRAVAERVDRREIKGVEMRSQTNIKISCPTHGMSTHIATVASPSGGRASAKRTIEDMAGTLTATQVGRVGHGTTGTGSGWPGLWWDGAAVRSRDGLL